MTPALQFIGRARAACGGCQHYKLRSGQSAACATCVLNALQAEHRAVVRLVKKIKQGDRLRNKRMPLAGDCLLKNWAEGHSLGEKERLSSTLFGRKMSERFSHEKTRSGKVYKGLSKRSV